MSFWVRGNEFHDFGNDFPILAEMSFGQNAQKKPAILDSPRFIGSHRHYKREVIVLSLYLYVVGLVWSYGPEDVQGRVDLAAVESQVGVSHG